MHNNLNHYLRTISGSLLFWALAMFLWGLFRFYGLEQIEGINFLRTYKELQLKNVLRLFTFSGILLGLVFGHLEYFFEKYTIHKLSIGANILLKAFLYLITIITITSLIKFLAKERLEIDVNIDTSRWWDDQLILITLLYIFLVSLVYSFIKIANEKFGEGVFLKMLLGSYKNPKEEKRIFMFLDLKSSTTIAEQLGHFKYSQLIQSCFYDLNSVVKRYGAEIYQYVGDEAVLCWPYKKGVAHNNCIALFFAFQDVLRARKKYYQETYGLLPEFKAGVHGGALMVAEVGVVKKELAFHGDVINTSSRIQAACNDYNVSILLSEELKIDLPLSPNYSSKLIGNLLLKGKQKELKVLTIFKN